VLAGLATGAMMPLAVAQTATAKKIKAGELAKLTKDWDAVEFKYEGIPSFLVRVPKPAKFDPKTSRELEVEVKDKDGKAQDIYLIAYQAVCTHLGCAVTFEPKDRALDCPCHGSSFDAATGARTSGPARGTLTGMKLLVEKDVVYATGTI
jgi:Rieske Fe-S protein